MAAKEKKKFVSKEEVVNAIDETIWFHINRRGELVPGANSQTDIPLFRYSDICETIDRLFDEKE